MIAISVFVVVFLGLMFLRVPIAWSIIVGALAVYLMYDINMAIIPPAFLFGLDSFPLLAIPAFILAGNLMAQGGISSSLISFINSFVGRFRGSLGSVLVLSAMLFGSITGSSLATVTAIGGIMIPEMVKTGHKKEYVASLLASAGFLGILIPPSVPGVVYALATNQNVLAVWMCTMMPGIVLGIAYMIVNYFIVGRSQEKPAEPFRFKPFAVGIQQTIPKATVALVMPLIIFGGVYGGIFTATEAGAISVFYGLLAGWFIYPLFFKTKPDMKLSLTIRDSAISTATICILIAAATLVGRMISLLGVSALAAEFLMNITQSKVLFLMMVNVILLIMGMFLETNTCIIIFGPLFSAIAGQYGVDPIHFAAIMLLNLEIGLITPPFAANLFVACRMTNTSIAELIKPMVPFYSACIIVLLITTYIPQIVLWAPNYFR